MTQRPTSHDQRPPRKLPFVVRGLSGVSGFNDAASEMVYPLLPAFITITLGANAAVLGALDGAADFTAAMLRLVSGRIADRQERRKPIVFVGYLLAVLMRPLIALAQAAGMVIGIRVLDRVGKGLRSPARDAMIADAVPSGERGRAFGFQRAFDHAGAVVGGLMAWLLVGAGLTPRGVIAWSALPGGCAVLLLAWTLWRPASRGHDAVSTPRAGASLAPEMPSLASTRRFWIPVGALTLLIVSRLPETLLLLHLQRGGVALALIPLVWAGIHVVRSMAAYPAGRMVDALGERGVVAISGTFGALGAFGLSRAATPAALVAVFLLLGLVTGLSEPAERTLVARLAPRGAGRAFGEAQALLGMGALAAGIGYGALVDARGSATALGIAAAVGAVATLCWLIAARGLAP